MAGAITTKSIIRTAGEIFASLHHTLRADRSTLGSLPRWLWSFAPRCSTVMDSTPWLPFRAIRWLERYLTSQSRVFEYGSGGSTLFFAQRAGHVTSVEHDGAWYSTVKAKLKELGIASCEYLHLPSSSDSEPTPCERCTELHTSDRPNYVGAVFDDYVRSIDRHPDESFDLVVIDGRARVACIQHALPKVKPGGHILLDDSMRESYRRGFEFLPDECEVHTGIRPYSTYVCQCMTWRRPLAT